MAATARSTIWKRHIALPAEHGAWVFLLSPLAIGLFAGGRVTAATPFLILAALSAFLLRQPVAIAVKAYSGRRSRQDLPAARAWIVIYGALTLIAVAALVALGYAFVLILALPGVPVLAWHLYLVSRRAERRRIGVEIVAGGVLALAAPAAFWAGRGYADPQGWWLWALAWLQTAASIVYAYLRLEQRALPAVPPVQQRLLMGRRALIYTTFNLLAALGLALGGLLPPLLPSAYALQWLETVWGTLKPAVGVKPTRIGIRQLIVSTLFTVVFIIAWLLG